MRKSTKTLFSIFLSIIVMTCAALPLSSASAAGDNQLTVVVAYGSTALRNISVGISRVSDLGVLLPDGTVKYELTSEYSGLASSWPDDMSSMTSSQLVSLARTVMNHATSTSGINITVDRTGSDGRVVFPDLEPGLYLIIQVNPGNYTFIPSLVPVGRVAGENVTARLKTSRLPTPTPTVTIPESTPPGSEYPTEPTPTPTSTPTPTPSETEIIDPTPPQTETPGTDITSPSVPGSPTTTPGRIPQTGIFDFDRIIGMLISMGALLVTIGLIMNKRRRWAAVSAQWTGTEENDAHDPDDEDTG